MAAEIVELVGTITRVENQTGTTKNGPNKGKVYLRHDVWLMDEAGVETKAAIFNDSDLGNEVAALFGQRAKLTIKIQEREGYPPNLYINAVEALNGSTPVPVDNQTQTFDPEKSITLTPQGHDRPAPMPRNKDEDIRAMWAIKAAVNYVTHNGSGNLESDSKVIMELAKTFYESALRGPQKDNESLGEGYQGDALNQAHEDAPSW